MFLNDLYYGGVLRSFIFFRVYWIGGVIIVNFLWPYLNFKYYEI
jgi:hypothetical protein